MIYEVFIRSFKDSDGDGVGDLRGLIDKLDYLNDGDPQTGNDLGVDAIWLMPIFPAASYHGYDVIDFMSINPEYGTEQDFNHLVSEARLRGIRIILDLPLNHTSSQHPWFQKSQAGDPNYRDYYIWSEQNPSYKGPLNEEVWHPSTSGGYYYGIFNSGMPDLNYDNPLVTREMEKVTAYWAEEMGVDGFRLDAAQYLIEDGQRQDNTEKTHAWYREFRKYLKRLNPELITVGEIWNSTQQAARYVQGDELDLAFDFDLAKAMVTAAGGRVADQLSTVLDKDMPLLRNGAGSATFLTNHDIARAMNSFGGDSAKAKSAATILLTLPGTPFIYYGEEIGMTGEKPDPQIRTPMQWTGKTGAGFTEGTAWEEINPDFTAVNVDSQIQDPDSLLSHYRTMIRLRHQNTTLREGDLFTVDSGNRRVYSILRFHENEAILILINLGRETAENLELNLPNGPLKGTYLIEPILGQSTIKTVTATADGGFVNFIPVDLLPADGNVILRLVPGP